MTITIPQLAARWSVSVATIRRSIRRKRIAVIQTAKRCAVRISLDEVNRVEQRTVGFIPRA